jgi:hypothetical protein
VDLAVNDLRGGSKSAARVAATKTPPGFRTGGVLFF